MCNKSWARHLIGAAVLAATAVPVVAAPIIDFGTDFDVIADGSSYTQAGFLVTPTGGAAMVDTSFCDPIFEYCALGNGTSYMAALNDTQLTITNASGDLFNLGSFDASFLPSPFVNFSGSMFRLLLTGSSSIGGAVTQAVDLVEDSNPGDFLFSTYLADSSFTQLSSLTFSVCLVTAASCEAPWLVDPLYTNDAQFAIDNIAFNTNNSVPEPSVAWLAALGLAGLALARRRSSR